MARASITRWLSEIHNDPTVRAELSAALQVFRNAAFAFRRLVKAKAGTREALATTCSTLIGQGKDLLQVHLRENVDGEPEQKD